MPNRKQIIVISVLGILALLLGCKPNATEIGEVAGVHRELTLEEKKVVGTYERKYVNIDFHFVITTLAKNVFLDNGTIEHYTNGKKQNTDYKWSIVENEIHIKNPGSGGKGAFIYAVEVWRLNPDNSLTWIAIIENGKRKELTKKQQDTYIKIK